MENVNPNTTIKNNEVVNVHTFSSHSPNPSINNIIDIRQIIIKYLRKWYWFVIAVILCFSVAYIYLKMTSVQFQVQTTILLRKDEAGSGLLDLSMLEGMGLPSSTSKEVEDEIQVLSSKSIMQKVIQNLQLETEYFEKKGWKYEELYPSTPIRLTLPATFNDTIKGQVELKIKQLEKGIKVSLKSGVVEETYLLSDINKAFLTPFGPFKLTQISAIKKGQTFKIITYPKRNLTEMYCASIKVGTVNKKSNGISITTVSSHPKKAQAVLKIMLSIMVIQTV